MRPSCSLYNSILTKLSSLGLRLPAPCAAQPQPQLSLDLEVASSALLDLHKKNSFLQSVVKTRCYLYELSLYLQLSIAANMNLVLKPHLPGVRSCKTKKALLSLSKYVVLRSMRSFADNLFIGMTLSTLGVSVSVLRPLVFFNLILLMRKSIV